MGLSFLFMFFSLLDELSCGSTIIIKLVYHDLAFNRLSCINTPVLHMDDNLM